MRRSEAIVLLLTLIVAACGEAATMDAGTDAGRLDGGRDAGRADGSVVMLDAGAVDGGAVDGGVVDGGVVDGGVVDAGEDAGVTDAGGSDAGTDAGPGATDAGPGGDAGARRFLLASFCPTSGSRAPGLYYGSLMDNTNDAPTGCAGISAPGRDGAVRVELAPGATVRATYRHAGDGVLYLLDSCPVFSVMSMSCLDVSDDTSSGAEMVEWTNSGGSTNPVYVFLDSKEDLFGDNSFELDLEITGP